MCVCVEVGVELAHAGGRRVPSGSNGLRVWTSAVDECMGGMCARAVVELADLLGIFRSCVRPDLRFSRSVWFF